MYEIIIELCERKSYNRAIKLLRKKIGNRRLDNFIKYIQQQKSLKSKSKLSFEVSNLSKLPIFSFYLQFQINIDEQDSKSRFIKTEAVKKTRKRKHESSVKRKKNVPVEFIQHIMSLGFDENDAPRLYEEKENWLSISSGGQG